MWRTDMALAWTMYTDVETGNKYWHNSITNVTQWTEPLPPPPPDLSLLVTSSSVTTTTEAPANNSQYAVAIMGSIIGVCVSCVVALFVIDCYCYPRSAEKDEEDEEEGGDGGEAG